ncbi:flagella basal body P-ring formation protein FlgA [uncultured Thiomicrorhabdus sp.]
MLETIYHSQANLEIMIGCDKTTTFRILLTFICLLLLSVSPNSYSQENEHTQQSLTELQRLVFDYVKEKTTNNPTQEIYEAEISVRPLSSNLRLGKCQNELQLNDRNPDDYLGRMTIGVSCEAPKWQVYIPAEVNGKTKVVLTTRALVKQSTISAQDIEEILMPYRNAPRGGLERAETAIGMRTKRAIGANTPLRIRDLQPAFIVFKKRAVNIVTNIGAVKVTTRGIAQDNAVKDEQVAVKNLSSGKLIRGIVIAPNTVYVP